MNLPGFISETGKPTVINYRGSVLSKDPDSAITPAEMGGPSTVPVGYERTCRRVPYTVCVGNRCWTEYGWECTDRPLSRT